MMTAIIFIIKTATSIEPLLYVLGQLLYMLYLSQSLQPHFTEKKFRLIKGKSFAKGPMMAG